MKTSLFNILFKVNESKIDNKKNRNLNIQLFLNLRMRMIMTNIIMNFLSNYSIQRSKVKNPYKWKTIVVITCC